MSNSNLVKGTLQTIILKLLSDHEKMYGYEITQKVKELTGGGLKITEGALYPALHKLEAEGLLLTTTEIVDNRVRKYYSLSGDGANEVKQKLSDVETFVANLTLVLNLKTT